MNSNISSLCIAGDLFTDTKEDLSVIQEIFKKLTENNKLLVLNLEGSLRYKSSKIAKNKAIPLSLEPKLIDLISKYNICVSIANNHSTDFGNISTIYTQEKLKKANIPFFGLFVNGDITETFCKVGNDKNSNPIYFVGCGWKNEQCIESTIENYGCLGFKYEDLINVFNHIKNINKNSRIFLISHFGYEYEYWPLPEHVEISRKLIDYGFEGVFGSHTHTIQEFEFFKNKPIYYGLGNLFFSSFNIKHSSLETKGRIVNIAFSSNKIKCQNYLISQKMDNNFIRIYKDDLTKSSINKDIKEYSKSYKFIRIRKKNPRPILYPNSKLYNLLIYKLWKFLVEFLGYIKCRKLIKKLFSL